MSFLGFFICCFVLVMVINLLIVVFGFVVWQGLLICEYFDVDVFVVLIFIVYFGVSLFIVENMIIELIEQGFGGIEGICVIFLMSVFGVSIVNIEFEVGCDLDFVVIDVLNVVQ